jgi:hypothetical protein
MATNRDVLKQAIADAKTVKETAIVNAKAALEETFAPYLREKLAAKLAEMDSMDEEMKDETMDEAKEEKGYEKMDETAEEAKEEFSMSEEMKDETMDETKSMDEELEELLRELDMEEDEEPMEEVINDPKSLGAHGNIAPSGINDTDLMEAKEAEDEEDEEINIEDMSEEDLKSFIEDVIKDMVEAGELEAGHEGMEDEEGMEGEEDELDELLKGMKKDTDLTEKAKTPNRYKEMEGEMSKMKKDLDEAYEALIQVRNDLNEVNLLNSKLLYTNKIFKAKNLTDSQKVKVLEAFDKATNKKEAKLVYETVIGNLNTTTKSPVTESVKGMASKVISGNTSRAKQPIIEVNSAFERMQKLAGIKK